MPAAAQQHPPRSAASGAQLLATALALLVPSSCTEEPSCPQETVVAGSLEIFAHEASRPGATRKSQGSGGDRACSGRGVLPWTRITRAQAEALCRASGFSLCTRLEWQRACGGPQQQPYPYGSRETAQICNDYLAGSTRPLPAGEKQGCVSPEGAYDMVGNVWEWVLPDADPGAAAAGEELYAGGSYKVTQLSRSLHPNRCDSEVRPASGSGYQAEDVGFRCCRPVTR